MTRNSKELNTLSIKDEVESDVHDVVQNYIEENIDNVKKFIAEIQDMDVDVLDVFMSYKGLKEGLDKLNGSINLITQLINRMAEDFIKRNQQTGQSFKQFLENIDNRESLIIELEKGLKNEMKSMLENGVFKFNIDNFIFYLTIVNNNLSFIKEYLATAHQSLPQRK